MKKVIIMAFAISLIFASCSDDVNVSTDETNIEVAESVEIKKTPIPGSYIVTLKENTFESVDALRGRIKSLSTLERASQKEAYLEISDLTLKTLQNPEVFDFGIDNSKITKSFSYAINGFMVENLTDQEVKALENDSRVDFVEQDYSIESLISYTSAPIAVAIPNEVTPWGITRVGGAVNATNISNSAWVVDTGIDLDHEDLNVDTSRSVTFVTTENGPNDFGGHGTHCAGTIAAIDNSVGVVGVAAGADVIAVKVLNANGGADSFGWVTSGIDYVTANASSGDVANLSLGYTNVRAWDRATRKLARAGVKVAVAAGNDYSDCSSISPARVNHNNIYTVSSIAEGDYWSRFSNYGSPVDYAAPGSDVLSTTPGDNYEYYSGTSMATPHIAGILLLGNVVSDGVPSGAYYEVLAVPGGYIWGSAYSPTNDYQYSLYRYDVDGNDDPIATHGQ